MILGILFLLISLVGIITTFLVLRKRKINLQVFPEHFKQRYLNSVILFTRINLLALLLALSSIPFFKSPISIILCAISSTLCYGVLLLTLEEFEEFDMTAEDVERLKKREKAFKKEMKTQTEKILKTRIKAQAEKEKDNEEQNQ